MSNFLKSENEVRFNAKIKYYPDGSEKLIVFNKPVYILPGYEQHNYTERERPEKYNTDGESRIDNLIRSKNKVFDIAFMNDFQYFVTITLDKEKIDRYDISVIKKAIRTFLNNQAKRKGLVYLILPEFHKDGAIHFHGLIKGDKLNFTDSGKQTKDGKVIYNWLDWKYGFSTAIPLTGDTSFVAKYITKYVTKDFKKIFGQYYLAGGNGLIRDVPFELFNTDFDCYNCQEISIQNTNLKVKYPEENKQIDKLMEVL